MPKEAIVILGSGMSGGVAAKTLREEGYDGGVVMIGHEPTPPFGRPPLSKTYLRGEETLSGWLVRPEDWYRQTTWSVSMPPRSASTPARVAWS